MADPTPAKTKIRVEMNSARYALRELTLKESSKRPNAMPGMASFMELIS